jgi:paraquat-inducible protein B
MGRRANPTLIGAFIVGAAALIVIGLLAFGRGLLFTERRTYVLYFDGSVRGLNVGAPVEFQGVRIGSVTNIKVQVIPQTNEIMTPVYIQVETDRVAEIRPRESREERLENIKVLVQRGLRAQLQSQSFVTGQLIVELGFHPDTPVRLVLGDPDTIELPTIPTTLQQAQAAAQDVMETLRGLPLDQLVAGFMETIQGTNRLVNAPEVLALIRTLNETLVDVRRLVQQDSGQVVMLLNELQGASTAARALLTDLQQLTREVDSQIGPLADSAKQTLDGAKVMMKDGQQLVRNLDGRIGPLSDNFADTAKTAQTTLATAQRRLDDNLFIALQELTAAMRSIRVLADFLERNPNALLFGRGGDRR